MRNYNGEIGIEGLRQTLDALMEGDGHAMFAAKLSIGPGQVGLGVAPDYFEDRLVAARGIFVLHIENRVDGMFGHKRPDAVFKPKTVKTVESAAVAWPSRYSSEVHQARTPNSNSNAVAPYWL